MPNTERSNIEPLTPPNGDKKVLLHSCCAPCSGDLIERMVESGIDLHLFFYNPNIHPKKEYEIRKNENIRFAEKLGIPFVDADYDVQNWFRRAKGLEMEPEKGVRFRIRQMRKNMTAAAKIS